MKMQVIIKMMRYAVVFSTSLSAVSGFVANRLRNVSRNGKDFSSRDTDALILKSIDSPHINTLNYHMHTVPVHHFGRHGLCSHDEGRQRFYRAVKSKLCQITGVFAADLIEDLCKHRGSFLDMWVSELFDIDGDGMVSHYEKQFYDELES